ncbi:AAA family ATPase [Nonomuraea sp. NPDC052129]|uniref:AAA family ATPase n=1 Tax=Nonomuraea sp. NPDC052129 TaxID=3154651 RepID=UPI00341753AE
MAEQRLSELRVENFRSLRQITMPLGPVNVLVGPNGAGKTNVLKVFEFLADIVRTDLEPVLAARGGFEELVFRGGADRPDHLLIGIKGAWSSSLAGAPDEYVLKITNAPLAREEVFRSADVQHRLRTITVEGTRAKAQLRTLGQGGFESRSEWPPLGVGTADRKSDEVGIQPLSSGLSTLPRLAEKKFSMAPTLVADMLRAFRVFDVDVSKASMPSRVHRGGQEPIADNAANLAAFLLALRNSDEDAWSRLQADAVEALPQVESLDFDYPSGGAHSVVVVLRERGLREPTSLLDASYGTIRLLGLLAMLYDPAPPALTCVEEIDHGLHPQALELLVERVREASEKTQFIIATHSPALADRLKPEEIVICERGDDGSSLIPAISTVKVEEIVRASEGLPLGELWFSGVLGGDL